MEYTDYNEQRRVLLDKEKEARDKMNALCDEINTLNEQFAKELAEKYKDYAGKLVKVKGHGRWQRMIENIGYLDAFEVARAEYFRAPYAMMYKPKKDGSKSKVQFSQFDRIYFDRDFSVEMAGTF